MARLWDIRKDENARGIGDSTPNIDALQAAVNRMEKWTVDDVLTELGGTGRDASHRLAEKLLEARGMEVNKTNISSQMRSINRWIAYESGETGKQARNPSKGTITVNGEKVKVSTLLNRIGRNAQAARDGFDIEMRGDIKVSGYRRSNRSANITLQGDAALAFLENPTYEILGEAYTGDKDFAGYGDIKIDIQF